MPGAERECLQLGGERRVPALGALEHAVAEAPHVVARVTGVCEERQVGVEAERRARRQRRRRPRDRARAGPVASVLSVASAVSASAAMGPSLRRAARR